MQAQAFASWKDLIAYRRAKHNAMSDSVRRLLQGTLGRAFAAWSSRVHEKAALKHKAVQCLARLTHAHAASAFAAWLDWAAEQKEHRSALVPYLLKYLDICTWLHQACCSSCLQPFFRRTQKHKIQQQGIQRGKRCHDYRPNANDKPACQPACCWLFACAYMVVCLCVYGCACCINYTKYGGKHSLHIHLTPVFAALLVD